MSPPSGRRRTLFSPTAQLCRARALDGYVRVSRVGDRSGEHFISPDVQEEQIRAYAQARGLSIDIVHHELDRSGMTLNRALLQRAIARIEAGESLGLVVARIDRFARTAAEALEAIARIQQAGGEFISVEDGLDSSTPFGKAMMTILLALAELELGRVRDSWRAAQAHAVGRGIHITGKPPAGYRRKPDGRLEPIPEQARALRTAFLLRGFGALPSELLTKLQEAEGIGADGRISSTDGVNYLLRNPVYTGEARCGDYINPDAHEPIVRRVIWIAAQDPHARTGFNRYVSTLLAGLVYCAACGSRMRSLAISTHHHAWRPGADFAYYCKGSDRSHADGSRACIANTTLERYVVDRFFRWFTSLNRASAEKRITEAEAEVLAADRAFAALALAAPEEEWQAAREASREAWQELAAIARLALVLELDNSATLRTRWPKLTIRDRRQILAAAINTIEIEGDDDAPAYRRTKIRFVGG